MSSPTPHVKSKWDLVRLKAQAGVPLYKCLPDIEVAIQEQVERWLRDVLMDELAQTDDGENQQGSGVEKRPESQ